jgi:NADP-dependent 3-hydroxy acid dehydrogenase YdfG
MSAPVWLITGASNGLGLVLTLHVLRAGHRVVASVRSKAKSADAVEKIEQAGGSVIEMDMTESQASIASKVKAIGRIDFLINNAGYSLLAACEVISYVNCTYVLPCAILLSDLGILCPASWIPVETLADK